MSAFLQQFSAALPALRRVFGETVVYRNSGGDRRSVEGIIHVLGDNADARERATGWIERSLLPHAPTSGDVIEHGSETYGVGTVDSDEVFWILGLRLRSKTQ